MTVDYLLGRVQAVFFEKPSDFFKIILVAIEETSFEWHDPEIVVTGNFADLDHEQLYKFQGQVVQHPKYGQQFKCNQYQKKELTDRKSLINYFSGTDFPGIGTKTATKIVEKLGTNAIQQILHDDQALQTLKIPAAKKALITKQVQATYESEEIILQLNTLGFGNKLAFKIYHFYRENTLATLQKNPYQLMKDINGIGFKRADSLAKKFDLPYDYPQRIQAGLWHTINRIIGSSGNTYVPQGDLIEQTLKLLNTTRSQTVTTEQLQQNLNELIDQELIVQDHEHYCPKYLFDAEWMIARQLALLIKNFSQPNFSSDQVVQILQKQQTGKSLTYDDNQLAAILQGINSPVFILTGGPGTGKTTIINGLVQVYAQLHHYSLDPLDYEQTPFPIVLAAPTGRAAKHLAESTGLTASTIHRLLGLTGQEDLSNTEVNSLQGKLLIVDETSMVDTYLFKLLVTAIPLGMQIVLVGDRDQLPSVGPGQVFADLIDSQVFPTVKLQKIYRQAADSTIINLAHEINSGQIKETMFQNFADRSFIECNAAQVPVVLQQIVPKSQAKGFDLAQVQVLTPMYRGDAGINNLNHVLQATVNPAGARTKKITYGDLEYRIGDKVVQLNNNVEANVFNGEIGTIEGITLANEHEKTQAATHDLLHIDFEGQKVTYTKAELNNISLAYCASIHKAQGSEFQLVILVLVNQNFPMLRRNLLYTAVTRAKSKLVMVGNRQAFERAIMDDSDQRQTQLPQRLQTVFDKQPSLSTAQSAHSLSQNSEESANSYLLTLDLIRANQIDPLIGMQNISPADFLDKS